MKTYPIVTMNMRDGSVTGHAAGCADLTRATDKFAEPDQANWVLNVMDKHEAWLEYNSDFIQECDVHDQCDEAASECRNAYDIHWLPCASDIPWLVETP